MTGDGQGPVALVTGGAGGIGSAIVRRLAADGHRIVVADLDADAAAAVAQTVGGAAVGVDVSDLDANRAMVAETLKVYGRLDAVVLNAGINSGIRADQPLDLTRYRRALSVNIDGVAFGMDACVPALMEQGGDIVVLASLAALWPGRSNPVYALTKAAVVGYTRAVARPLEAAGVRVNAVCPGFVDTSMLGPGRAMLVERDFPIIPPEAVADAVRAVMDSGRTGLAWSLIAGRPPIPYELPPMPPPLRPDGTQWRLPDE